MLSANNVHHMKRLKSAGFDKYQYQSKTRDPGLLCSYPVGQMNCYDASFGCCGPEAGSETPMHMESARPLFQDYARTPRIQINRYAQVSRLKRRLLLSSQSRSQKRSGNSYFDDAGSYEEIVQAGAEKAPKMANFSRTQEILGHKKGAAGTDFSQT